MEIWVYFCGWDVGVGWIYMFIWLGCVRRVEMYWVGGRRETTPLYHICYIMFISSWKNSIPSTWKRWLKLKTKIASVQNKKKSFIYNKDYFTEPYTFFLVGMTQKECKEDASHTLLTVRHVNTIRSYQISHYSAALLILFDRRWLISFMAIVFMTQN